LKRDYPHAFLHIDGMTTIRVSRRYFFRALTLGIAAVSFAARHASGEDAQNLDPKDPKAATLGYVLDASTVDAKKYPSYVKGSNCDNCLQLQGKPGPSFRPCSLFPGKLVAIGGWCSGWTAEM